MTTLVCRDVGYVGMQGADGSGSLLLLVLCHYILLYSYLFIGLEGYTYIHYLHKTEVEANLTRGGSNPTSLHNLHSPPHLRDIRDTGTPGQAGRKPFPCFPRQITTILHELIVVEPPVTALSLPRSNCMDGSVSSNAASFFPLYARVLAWSTFRPSLSGVFLGTFQASPIESHAAQDV